MARAFAGFIAIAAVLVLAILALAEPSAPPASSGPWATATTSSAAPDSSTRPPLGAALDRAMTSTAPRLSPAARIFWRGGSWYLHGANVPWINWSCDFGCGAKSGVSNARVKAAASERFAQARAAGMRVLRWWTFEGDAWQVQRDASGAPAQLSSAVYADFDAALELAQTHDLYYVFVLFSGVTSLPADWLREATKRTRLADALAPLFARYADNSHVLAWEIFNEPEWDIWKGQAAPGDVQATVKAIAQAVRANSPAYVTVGSAMLDGLPLWLGQGLDFYQAHWYDYMSQGDYCAACVDYPTVKARYGLDAPLVIGELYAGSDASDRFDAFYAKGYAGAWPWSLVPERTHDRMAIDLRRATSFSGLHTDLGPRADQGAR